MRLRQEPRCPIFHRDDTRGIAGRGNATQGSKKRGQSKNSWSLVPGLRELPGIPRRRGGIPGVWKRANEVRQITCSSYLRRSARGIPSFAWIKKIPDSRLVAETVGYFEIQKTMVAIAEVFQIARPNFCPLIFSPTLLLPKAAIRPTCESDLRSAGGIPPVNRICTRWLEAPWHKARATQACDSPPYRLRSLRPELWQCPCNRAVVNAVFRCDGAM